MKRPIAGKGGVKNKLEARMNVKIEFVKCYSALFERQGRAIHLNNIGKAVVKIARKLIGYSTKTADCDIYWILYCLWHKVVLGCRIGPKPNSI